MLNDTNENHQTDALRAMADGVDTEDPQSTDQASADDLAAALGGLASASPTDDPPAEAVAVEELPTSPIDEPVAPAGEQMTYALSDADEPTGAPPVIDIASRRSPTAVAARAQQAARQQRQHAGLQFRRIAMPLLLIMGLLLFAVAIGTMAIRANANPETLETNRLLRHGRFFAGLCLVLGVILLGGAAFFWYEVRKHNGR